MPRWQVVIGTAAGLQLEGGSGDATKTLKGVELESGEVLECDVAIVAMGVWSTLLEDWIGLPTPIEGACAIYIYRIHYSIESPKTNTT
jgi:glycine/D-amino acid oxidase-like deaminating enzyme